MTKRFQTRSGRLLAAAVAAGLTAWSVSAAGQEADSPAVDTSEWECAECPFELGWNGHVDLGAGYVSDDSFKFGEYSGLEDEGAYAVGGLELRFRGEEAGYWTLRGEDLGLESRSVTMEGGRQGSYRLFLEYHELPHYITDATETVFRGVGSDHLRLPTNWDTANTTQDMSDLAPSLRGVEIERDRTTLGAGFGILQGESWQYDVRYWREEEEGTRIQGGKFSFTSSLLPVPVEYITDQLEASVAYAGEAWKGRLAYHGSFFRNKNDALTWDNPFDPVPVGPGGTEGRMALPPDNRFSQLSLSGSWHPGGSLTASGRVAYGRMEQNEDFLPATINSGLSPGSLPRDDLGGRVDTLTADLRVTARPADRLTLQGEVYYDDRDNQTPRDSYTQVSDDLFIGDTRTNRPYSFEKLGGEVDGELRVVDSLTAAAGGSLERHERTLQEVEETVTGTVWGELRATPGERVDITLRHLREQRDRSGSYEALGLTPPKNPSLRKFYLADRDRELTRFSLRYLPTHRLSMGLSVDYAEDDYTDSSAGLTEATDLSSTLDVSYSPLETLTTYAYASLQRIESDIRGRDNVTGALWVYGQKDTIRSAGIGGEIRNVADALDLETELSYSETTGEIDVDKAGGAPSFPDLETRLLSFRLGGSYRLSEHTEVGLGYRGERYRTKDFFIDDVAPDTISNVLTLGDEGPDYTVHVAQLFLRVRF